MKPGVVSELAEEGCSFFKTILQQLEMPGICSITTSIMLIWAQYLMREKILNLWMKDAILGSMVLFVVTF